MYEKYLKEVYDLYKKIESFYPKVNSLRTKRSACYSVSKKLKIPLCDSDAALSIINEKYPSMFIYKNPPIRECVRELILAKINEDNGSAKRINLYLKKKLKISDNTLAKYVKIILFQEAISMYGTISCK